MKKYIIWFICFVAGLGLSLSLKAQEDFRKTAPAALPAPKIQLGNYVQNVLPNGLKVIVVENHKLPKVSFQIFVDAPIHLEGEFAGVGDMAGSLLGNGTKTKTKAQLDEAIDFIGANIGSSASGLFGSGLTKHQDKILALMSDMLFNSTFPEEEFEKLKKQTLSGLADAKEKPEAIASNVSSVVRYGKNHPYGELTTEKTVNKITVEQCRNYYQTYFKPNISYLIIVGDITPAAALAKATQYFGKWQKGTVAKTAFTVPVPPKPTQVDLVNRDGSVQSVIDITYPVQLKLSQPDYLAVIVMNTLLGTDFTSRLTQNLREDKAYTYGVGSNLSPDLEVGYFTASGSFRNSVTDSAIVEFMNEFKRMRDTKASTEELNRIKAVMAGNFAMGLERPQTIARFALYTARYGLPQDYYRTYLERLSKITAEEVQAAAQKYLMPENAHIVVVGSQDDVAEKLKAFGPLNYYDSYGNPIKAPSAATNPGGITAEQVIDKYVQAIGGKEKLMTIKDEAVTMEATVQGMPLEMVSLKKEPGKLSISVSVGGNVMQSTVYDGKKGQVTQQGQAAAMSENDLVKSSYDAAIFPELHYSKTGHKLSYKGIEAINGADAHKIVIEDPKGNKETTFFDVKTGYMVKNVEATEAGATTLEFGDYQAKDGIYFPRKVTITGALPFPLEFSVKSVEWNKGIDDTKFKVE
ncbi:MAG TPA: pitrilysin family protein [Haliscomenobacter sp.]|nr:pitrilysin family protein [Haliscomenobacter sp.]